MTKKNIVTLTEGSSFIKETNVGIDVTRYQNPNGQGNSHYVYGDRYCETCNRWYFPGPNLFCDCCNHKLRCHRSMSQIHATSQSPTH